MSEAPVIKSSRQPRASQLKRAHELLKYGIESTNSLARLYNHLMKRRGRGAPKHEEQDLLRAMVVMAGATLDIVVKSIIRDALQFLIAGNEKAKKAAREHVHRRLLKDIEQRGGLRLAQALLSDSPRAEVIGFVIEDITGVSLQSVDQLKRAADYLGLKDFKLSPGVSNALAARNQIVHEMDAIEEQPGGRGSRKRRQRRKDEMLQFAKVLLETAGQFCNEVDKALTKPN